MGSRSGCARAAALLLAVLVATTALAAEPLQLNELGEGPVPVSGVGNAELSGITWAGGSRFFAVDDGRSRMFPLEVTIDPARGSIQRIEAGEFVSLKGARDIEGVAWRPVEHTVLVTDEIAHQIREFDPSSGVLQRSVPPPAPFPGRIRKNRGLEGIAISPDGESVWIANEAPLRLDGDNAGALEGGLVRLQRLDAALAPAGQWAYLTEKGLGFVGVVDLLVAPGGELLVLERALTGGGFSARIFQVDFSEATDVTQVERLRSRPDLHTVRKVKLWERSGGFQNFEGLALGPELAIGGRLVLLVSDGGGQRQPSLLALRLIQRGAKAKPQKADSPPAGQR